MIGTSAIVKAPIRLPGISHTFQPGTVLKAMGPSAAMSVENYGEDVALWKGQYVMGESCVLFIFLTFLCSSVAS